MITSLTNSKVKYIQRLQQERRFRTREQAFVVEGTRWLWEVQTAKVQPSAVFYTPQWAETAENQHLLQSFTAVSQPVAPPIMAAMSDTETPPGILAVLPIQPCPLPAAPAFLLILDGITTPGNLGTMLRTAAAAGVEGVLLGPGCVDAYNPKVVRGGMGAHLRLPVHHKEWIEIGQFVAGMGVWLATVDGEVAYTAVSWQQPSALIIGSEATGAGEGATRLANGRISIPMHAQTESLNAAVAAGIILFEAVRQRRLEIKN